MTLEKRYISVKIFGALGQRNVLVTRKLVDDVAAVLGLPDHLWDGVAVMVTLIAKLAEPREFRDGSTPDSHNTTSMEVDDQGEQDDEANKH